MRTATGAYGLEVGVRQAGEPQDALTSWKGVCVAAAMLAVVVQHAIPFPPSVMQAMGDAAQADGGSEPALKEKRGFGREAFVGGYIGYPWHLRSDVRLQRPNGTDVTLKSLRWDAEPFKFPIYAGVRGTQWWGPFGGMIDFLHDKAIARTGRGAHGAKVVGERAIPDVVEAQGTIKGAQAPASVKLTDVFERLEFSHGHNMLLPTALVRLANVSAFVRPYAGFGFGAAIPHVEVWPAGEGDPARTNEYQLAGTAAQFVLGLEIPLSKGPVFIEYKFTYANLDTALTTGKTPSWCNCDFVSDFARHIARWWRGEGPLLGSLQTTIATHQVVAGAGYRIRP